MNFPVFSFAFPLSPALSFFSFLADTEVMTTRPVKLPGGERLADDAQLSTLAQQGDRSAFETLVKRHQKKILNACYRLVGYSEDARELAADTFAEAFRSLKSFRQEAQFGTWLYRIALNLCFQHLRQKTRTRRLMVDTSEEALESQTEGIASAKSRLASEALEWEETMGTVRQTLAKISKPHAEILIMCDIEGLSYAEVSKLLGCPAGTVMSRLSRARDAFRKVWNQLAED